MKQVTGPHDHSHFLFPKIHKKERIRHALFGIWLTIIPPPPPPNTMPAAGARIHDFRKGGGGSG